MQYFVGIDVGASATKAIILSGEKEVLGYAVNSTGADFAAAAARAFAKARSEAGCERNNDFRVVATGYGRRNVPNTIDTVTEISCHAAGSFHHFPKAHTLIDIGGQDSKMIRLNDAGKRVNFKMNRKCAAGTGSFLEEIATRLDTRLDQLNNLAREATKDIEIGSYCTVFTGTEILARIREGVHLTDIVKGIFNSVIKRAFEMGAIEGNLVMSGGVVAHNPFLVEMMEQKMGRKILVPPLPQSIGALGAALFSRRIKGEQDA